MAKKVTKIVTTSSTKVSEVIEDTRVIMASVSDPDNNVLFPALKNPTPETPVPGVPTYTQVKTAVDNLEAAQIKYKRTRTPSDRTARDNAKLVLVQPVTGLIPLVAAYVQQQSGTNMEIMQKSGFALTNQPQSVDELDQPENLKPSFKLGGFKFSVNPVPHASGMYWKLTPINGTTKEPLPGVEPFVEVTDSFSVEMAGTVKGTWYLITGYAFAAGGVKSPEFNSLAVVSL